MMHDQKAKGRRVMEPSPRRRSGDESARRLAMARRAMGPNVVDKSRLDATLVGCGAGIAALTTSTEVAGAAQAAAGKLAAGVVGSGTGAGAVAKGAGFAATTVGKAIVMSVAVGSGAAGVIVSGYQYFAAPPALSSAAGQATLPPATAVGATPAVPRSLDPVVEDPSSHANSTQANLPELPAPSPSPSLSKPVKQLAPRATPGVTDHSVKRSAMDPAKDTVRREVEALRVIHQVLEAGDAAGALRLLQELTMELPNGALLPERRVTEVLILCARGDNTGAKQLAERLLARDGSFYRSRLMNSCAAPDGYGIPSKGTPAMGLPEGRERNRQTVE